MADTPFIECIPNFSEGRNEKIVDAIVQAMDNFSQAAVLHVDRGYDANRTVVTVAGTPQAVFESARAGIRTAYDLINMRKQTGVHPRLGAVDVCPFVALRNISTSALIKSVDQFAERLASELDLPIYLYGKNARTPGRIALSAIRQGEYEGLRDKLVLSEGRPDLGPGNFNARFGAMTLGVRDLMIAYNIHLDTQNISIAKRIAGDLRESGRLLSKDGIKSRKPGRFRGLKAIGWDMPSYGWAQVSMNVMDYQLAPVHEIYEAAKERAAYYGVSVQGSELIGMAPLAAMRSAGLYYARQHSASGAIEEKEWMSSAIQGLGLDRLGPISLSGRIIEYMAAKKGLL